MENFNIQFPQIGRKSLITQGVTGLAALFLFMTHLTGEQFLLNNWHWGMFAYVSFSLSTMLTWGIQQNNKTTEIGKKCHYCEGPIEALKYRCKRCEKEQ